MRVVPDTNVVVSGLIRPVGSPPGELLDLWFTRGYDLVTSAALLAEYREVLNRPRIRRLIRDHQALLRFLDLLGVSILTGPFGPVLRRLLYSPFAWGLPRSRARTAPAASRATCLRSILLPDFHGPREENLAPRK